MYLKHIRNSLSIACLFALLVLALIASPCRHTEAASTTEAMDEVMKTIRDYGRGHSGVLSSGSSAKPDESDDVYSARIGKLLVHEDFAELEKIAQKDRSEKGRLFGGVWKILAFMMAPESQFLAGRPANRITPYKSAE
jgi:hypothetical protein